MFTQAKKRIAFSAIKNKIELRLVQQNESYAFSNKKFDKIDMASKCREELDTWLVSQIATEGWTAEPAAAHL